MSVPGLKDRGKKREDGKEEREKATDRQTGKQIKTEAETDRQRNAESENTRETEGGRDGRVMKGYRNRQTDTQRT